MRPDDLEFLIAQYADSSLDPQRSAELEAVLRRDTSARAMLESYRSLDGVLAGVSTSDPLPQLQWDQLAARLSDQVGRLENDSPLTEEAEETLSRLSSGHASAIEQSLVESRLVDSPAYRLALVEYAALDHAFETVRATPLPPVQWDRFAPHISSQLDQQEADRQQSMRLAPAAGVGDKNQGIWGRIGQFAAQPRRMAIAASLLIAATVSVMLVNQGGNSQPAQSTVVPMPKAPGGATPLAVTGPLQVQVGPSFDVNDYATITSVNSVPLMESGSAFIPRSLVDTMRQYAGSRPSQSSVSRPATKPQSSNDSVDSLNALFPSR
jgi:hypothetical protein